MRPHLFHRPAQLCLYGAQGFAGDGGDLPQGQFLSVAQQDQFALVILQYGKGCGEELSVLRGLITGFRPADDLTGFFGERLLRGKTAPEIGAGVGGDPVEESPELSSVLITPDKTHQLEKGLLCGILGALRIRHMPHAVAEDGRVIQLYEFVQTFLPAFLNLSDQFVLVRQSDILPSCHPSRPSGPGCYLLWHCLLRCL